MARYILWDHTSNVITPSGEVFTAEEWEDRYPAAAHIDYVMSGSEMNGALMQSYGAMIDHYTAQGCDFTGCITKQQRLNRIEQFEDEQAEAAKQAEERRKQEEAAAEAAAEELALREIEALEDLVVLNMPDA